LQPRLTSPLVAVVFSNESSSENTSLCTAFKRLHDVEEMIVEPTESAPPASTAAIGTSLLIPSHVRSSDWRKTLPAPLWRHRCAHERWVEFLHTYWSLSCIDERVVGRLWWWLFAA
jgi:hypothetical protein